MTEETQQKISKALAQTVNDLYAWMKEIGAPERQVVAIYEEAVREGGLLAKLLATIGSSVIPFPMETSRQPQSFEKLIQWIRSGEFSAWLMKEPKPTEEEVNQLVSACRNVLPTLRQRLSYVAKRGPQFRRGGRHKELTDPAVRREICDEIRRRRGARSKLAPLFKSIAKKYKVSDTTIKRIWLLESEKSAE